MNRISQFVNNEGMKEEVFEYLLSVLDKTTLELAYSGEDTSGCKQAKNTLFRAKKQMEDEFLPKKEKQDRNPV